MDEHKPWLSTKPSLAQELTFSLAGFISSAPVCFLPMEVSKHPEEVF